MHDLVLIYIHDYVKLWKYTSYVKFLSKTSIYREIKKKERDQITTFTMITKMTTDSKALRCIVFFGQGTSFCLIPTYISFFCIKDGCLKTTIP